ncbi:hypothetical protein B0T14DRAFT_451216 [Immersiella caudata]|uniref:AB hydrolase-1 domain-containing protein n=1 Tax=Immersiella caudata TaxID=314043 RepID=A0AA39X6U9_9PEZI|nr:hypothetical protein B0T14DRAFT_451216 [Immersiella caudata]
MPFWPRLRASFKGKAEAAASFLTPSPHPTTKIDAGFPSGIKVLHESSKALVDIVFIHGLTGDRERTWKSHEASEPWPKTLLPSELPTARIVTFGYDAYYVADWRGVVSENTVGDHASNLVTSLTSYREKDGTSGRPIIFVCHSLGGLVCQDALVKSKEHAEPHLQSIFQCTRAIAFLGTPHRGAGLAPWAERLSRSLGAVKQTNTRIVALLRSESEMLARIQESFHAMMMTRNSGKDTGSHVQHPIEISCFYEELPLPGIGRIVPRESAVLPGYISIGIHANHMDMARFRAADDPGFLAVCSELRRWVEAVATTQGKPERQHVPAPGTEGQSLLPESSGSGGAVFFVPYPRNAAFTGRSAIIEKLQKQPLQSGSQARTALFGLGGIGKTQIALEYAYRMRDTHPDISVFWVHASSAERFRQSFVSIATLRRIPGHDDPKADVLVLVTRWLEENKIKSGDSGPGPGPGRWLMILDNADDAQLFFPPPPRHSSNPGEYKTNTEGLGRYIPECAHGSVLVTTRNKQVGVKLSKGTMPPIEVDRMDESESEQILRTCLGVEEGNDTLLRTLASRLEHLPLALVQAAAFIDANTTAISEYLRLLDDSDHLLVDLLSEEFETVGRDSKAPRAVAETWIVSFEQIQRQDSLAGELLSLMSFFDRQAIPSKFLGLYIERQRGFGNGSNASQGNDTHITRMGKDSLRLQKALGILKAFSFFMPTVDENGQQTLSTHRLVQLVTKKWLASRMEGEAPRTMRDHFAGRALIILSSVFPFGDFENWETCRRYLPHVDAVLKHGIEDRRESRDERRAMAALLHAAGAYLSSQGRWKEAEEMQHQGVELRTELLGNENVDTLQSMGNLAFTYHSQGRLEKAESMFQDVAEGTVRLLGEEDPLSLTCMGNLASVYQAQGKWREAEALETRVVNGREKTLGEEHPDTLVAMGNLASTLWNLNRLQETERLERRVMEVTVKVRGGEHPLALTAMGNLASTYRSQGRWSEAEELEVQVVEASVRVLGREHPETLSSMGNLSATYRNQGQWDKAESLEQQVLEISKRVLGEDHPETLTSKGSLATLYRNQGRWQLAASLDKEVLEARIRVLGERHPHTLSSMANLASDWKGQGQLESCSRSRAAVSRSPAARLRILDHPKTDFFDVGRFTSRHGYGGRHRGLVLNS